MVVSLGVMTFIELMQRLAKDTWTRWTGTEIFWPWYTLIGVLITLGVAWAANRLLGAGTTSEERQTRSNSLAAAENSEVPAKE
jgi:hypothetical protein